MHTSHLILRFIHHPGSSPQYSLPPTTLNLIPQLNNNPHFMTHPTTHHVKPPRMTPQHAACNHQPEFAASRKKCHQIHLLKQSKQFCSIRKQLAKLLQFSRQDLWNPDDLISRVNRVLLKVVQVNPWRKRQNLTCLKASRKTKPCYSGNSWRGGGGGEGRGKLSKYDRLNRQNWQDLAWWRLVIPRIAQISTSLYSSLRIY